MRVENGLGYGRTTLIARSWLVSIRDLWLTPITQAVTQNLCDAAVVAQKNEVTALGHPALPEREEKGQGQTCLEAFENNSGHLDSGTEKRAAAALPI